MIIPKDQFWSLGTMSFRRQDYLPGVETATRYSFFWARSAIYYSLTFLGIAPGERVLVPSYVCRAVVDPLLAYGVDVDFYSIKTNCEPDFLDLEMKLNAKVRAIIAVHYFGFPQPITRFRKLCDKYGLALIEDCAHVLCGDVDGQPMGSFGDAAIFSSRKFLAVNDGAELVINRSRGLPTIHWSREKAAFTARVAINMLDARLSHTRTASLRWAYQGFREGRTVLLTLVRHIFATTTSPSAETNSVLFDFQRVNWPISRLSKWARSHADLQRVASTRRRNYNILANELSSLTNWKPLFARLAPTVCPWVFPILAPDVIRPHAVLRHHGIPAVNWSGVRHPAIMHNMFPDADVLYDNLVFLPVHQCLSDKDMMTICRAVRLAACNSHSAASTVSHF